MCAFALGAASGSPAARMSASATGCCGARIPTVSSPPLTSGGTRAERGTTSVSGPGQSSFTSRDAVALHDDDAAAATGELGGDGGADDAASDDPDVVRHGHLLVSHPAHPNSTMSHMAPRIEGSD